MKLLLDTHVLLWSLLDSQRLSEEAATAIGDPDNAVAVSAASVWEIVIKQSLGKLELPGPAPTWLAPACSQAGLDILPISVSAVLGTWSLPWHHRDPFDRLLLAQASAGYTLVTHDARLRAYGVPLLLT